MFCVIRYRPSRIHRTAAAAAAAAASNQCERSLRHRVFYKRERERERERETTAVPVTHVHNT